MTRLKSFEQTLDEGQNFEEFLIVFMEAEGYDLVHRSETSEPDLEYERFYLEAKYKARMKYFPATGFAHYLFLEYTERNKKKPVFVLFYDTMAKKFYGNWLNVLQNNIYRQNWEVKNGLPITVFYLQSMRNDWLEAIKELN